MIDRMGLVYTEIKIELLEPIWSGVVCDENQINQWHDQSYRCGLRRIQNWVVMTDWTGCRRPSVVHMTNRTNQSECHLWQKKNKTTMWSII